MQQDAFQWACDKYIAHDPNEVALYEEERIKADIAQAICDLRNRFCFSRQEPADQVGVAESATEDSKERSCL